MRLLGGAILLLRMITPALMSLIVGGLGTFGSRLGTRFGDISNCSSGNLMRLLFLVFYLINTYWTLIVNAFRFIDVVSLRILFSFDRGEVLQFEVEPFAFILDDGLGVCEEGPASFSLHWLRLLLAGREEVLGATGFTRG